MGRHAGPLDFVPRPAVAPPRETPERAMCIWATESSTWSVQRAAPGASSVTVTGAGAAMAQPAPLHCPLPRAVALSSSGSLSWGCRTLHVWGPHTTRGHVVAGCAWLRASPRRGGWPDTRCRSGELTPPEKSKIVLPLAPAPASEPAFRTRRVSSSPRACTQERACYWQSSSVHVSQPQPGDQGGTGAVLLPDASIRNLSALKGEDGFCLSCQPA